MLVLPVDDVDQTEEDEQELLHREQFHRKHLAHLGFLGPVGGHVGGGNQVSWATRKLINYLRIIIIITTIITFTRLWQSRA